ncbi:hypothetical protein GGI59_000887 [Rhizobium lentis]|uniref:Uncharacterized protein n=1 Tax=Rhizobium lentis TaxID=1138194 RepID=A0A7W8UM06_9HYPH|nr:hypothetical protein [Rhizobium lentis]MBB5548727.1 hypothetical protein [Rhizobium lentis]MBB5559260.1 hypothetical protein [Rhizobium lentis]MBB5565218.1 hypothetical protein [Rhizobium lentis]
METIISTSGTQALMAIGAATSSPSFLCLSQESSAPKSLGARDPFNRFRESFTAPTRGGWIPVTSTGMRECEATSFHISTLEGHG